MGHKHGTLEERLERHLDKSGECWLFQGCKRRGYGRLRVKGDENPQSAHRLAWELAYGPIPAGMFVLHNCDTPACCRPNHLHLGTHAGNMHEMVSRRRQSHNRGEAHHASKLTNIQVREIRTKYAAGGISQPALGRKYGVSQKAVWDIIHFIKWTHVL